MTNTDFHVCPEALRLQAEEVGQTADHWQNAYAQISTNPMSSGALGYFGTDIVTKFNEIAADVVTKLQQGRLSIESAADGLRACATHFENVDAEYYRQFGYIDTRLGY
ncbi:type VII secretion target [Nocardia cyriacigeorgica]|uniref:type VII secretion target n=1 Tax=Nocardia cyriacigeorgica TaxID=135487 RepID=UPI0024588B2A|nr:type VII secretion target [Nocardia cyriacigeorgica]